LSTPAHRRIECRKNWASRWAKRLSLRPVKSKALLYKFVSQRLTFSNDKNKTLAKHNTQCHTQIILVIISCKHIIFHPNDGRVVSNFIIQALKNRDITIFGDGSQTRSFQYVDDLIEGMIRMMNTDDSFIGPVNIGNPNEFTMLELAQKVIELTNSKSKIIFCPLPSDDPKHRKPDIRLAKTQLNWEPKIQLQEGLLKTIDYFKQII